MGRLAPPGWAGWWQALPLGPTGYGDSPYQCLSSFAGNELLISPDALIEDELLRPADCAGYTFSASAVEYEKVVPFKLHLIETAWSRFSNGARPDLRPAYEQFCQDHGLWLEDYALFRALKARYDGARYLDWPAEIVRRSRPAVETARRELTEPIELVRFAQFLLFRQAERLQQHAHDRGVRLIGDLPFFVSPDSSDVWAHPEFFLLGNDHQPKVVAGVPPDYFSAEGQLWGNPVYDWDALRQSGYRWYVDRLRALLAQRRRDSAGSFPRLCGGLARGTGSLDGTERANGSQAQAPSSSRPSRRAWAPYRSSRRTWG